MATEVHLWRIRPGSPEGAADDPGTTLSADERARAALFRDARDRARFVRSRLALRRILASYIGASPAGVRFGTGPHGKPSLASCEGDAPLEFNLSHAGDLAVVAVTRQAALGVDIEQAQAGNLERRLAKRILSSREWQAIAGLPTTVRQHAFLRGWTRKEAYLKATGEGLSFPLRAISVSLLDDEVPQLIEVEGRPEAPRDWTLHDLAPAGGYFGALCIAAARAHLRWFDLAEDLGSARHLLPSVESGHV